MMLALELIHKEISVNGTKTKQIMFIVVLLTLILLSVLPFVVQLVEILNATTIM